jgi:uncharacterized protein involved in exopolysaccharide biosynthesis
MPEDQNRKTLRDLLRVGFRHRLLFAAAFAVFAFAVFVGSLWWPLKYTAMAKFERRSDPASEDITRGKSESFESLKLTLQHELMGTGALDAAAEALEKKGLLPPLPRGVDGKLTPGEGQRMRQDVVRRLLQDVKVTFDVRSTEVDLVSVEYTDADPRLAQELPNALVVSYIERIGEQMITRLTASRDFLRTKADEANTRQMELTGKRVDFEIKHAGMLPDNAGALQQQIDTRIVEIDRLHRQQTLAKDRLDRLKGLRAFTGQAPAPEAVPAAGTPKEGADAPAVATKPPEKPDPVKSEMASTQVREEYRKALAEVSRLEDQKIQY